MVSKKLEELFTKWQNDWEPTDEKAALLKAELQHLDKKDIDNVIKIAQLRTYAENLREYNNKPAALLFLCILRYRPAMSMIKSCLEDHDLWTGAWAAAAVGRFWPHPEFINSVRKLRDRANEYEALKHSVLIRSGLALYLMKLPEGLDELIQQALDFDPRYDARNYHDRMWACRLIADYVRPEDVDKLIPLIGQGAYRYISGHLIEERGTSLIPVLRDELRKDGQVNPYIALTLCRLGDAEGFEITKEILLNYEHYQMLDSPVNWSSGALTLYAEHNPGIILPILVKFLEKEMLRPNGGHPLHIEWVVSRLKGIVSYSAIQDILEKIRRHVRDNPHWTAYDRRMVEYLFESLS